MTEEKDITTEKNGEDKTAVADNTDLEDAIIRQVEFYFGDMNLVRDKFLREQVKLDEGWIPLEILTRFNRLANLSKDNEVIANALNKSTSGLIEVSDDNKKVRRNPEMPVPEMNEERRKELQSRSVYAKGFPKDSRLDDILDFFKGHGATENVIMRRYPDKQTKQKLFKGSVFATFKDKSKAEEFIKNKDGQKYKEADLICLWQEDYVKAKNEEYAERKEKRDKKKDKGSNVKEEKSEFKLPTGTVLRFSEGHDTMKREDVKEALTAIGAEIAYIDFNLGDTAGSVRLTKENAAKEIFEKLADGKLKIGESDIVFQLLEGDEETTYLEKTVEEITKRRKNQKTFSKHNRGRQHKGKYHGKKRKQDHHDDAPPSKVKAGS